MFLVFKNFYLFIHLFLAVFGLRCCPQAFSSCREWGLLFVAVRGLLTVVTSLVVEHGLQVCGLQQLWHVGFSSCGSRALERRLSSCGTQALLLCGVWDLPRPGLQPMCPALAGGFLTTAPPGKSLDLCFIKRLSFSRISRFPSEISVVNQILWQPVVHKSNIGHSSVVKCPCHSCIFHLVKCISICFTNPGKDRRLTFYLEYCSSWRET